MVPIIAMGLSTVFEDYRWSPLAIAGAVLSLGGMLLALARRRRPTRRLAAANLIADVMAELGFERLGK